GASARSPRDRRARRRTGRRDLRADRERRRRRVRGPAVPGDARESRSNDLGDPAPGTDAHAGLPRFRRPPVHARRAASHRRRRVDRRRRAAASPGPARRPHRHGRGEGLARGGRTRAPGEPQGRRGCGRRPPRRRVGAPRDRVRGPGPSDRPAEPRGAPGRGRPFAGALQGAPGGRAGRPPAPDDVRHVIVLGSGPAGFTAALYAARADLRPLLLKGLDAGGQLMLTTEVENYPGFPDAILGPELMDAMEKQASRFGTEVLAHTATRLDLSERPFGVWAGDQEWRARTLIVATGASARWLGVPGEERLRGRGV